jgi:hypothetical protein
LTHQPFLEKLKNFIVLPLLKTIDDTIFDMNDPKVEALYYQFVSDNPNDKFDDVKTLIFADNGFDFNLDKDILTVCPQKQFSDPEQVKIEVEPILSAWEFSAFVRDNRHRIRFIYRDAKVIDLHPDPGNVTLNVQTGYFKLVGENVTLTVHNLAYPNPENNFVTSELTDELVDRLKQYTDGRETLPSMAYYILDRLEYALVGKEKNKRNKLAEIFKIHWKVLDKLGKLSNRSDTKIGRHGNEEPLPLTQRQINWLEQVSFRLVARVAEYNFNKNDLKLITLDDFPPLAD